ncbi:MAG: CinA family protein [Methanomassiliicoccaceae archaeon]
MVDDVGELLRSRGKTLALAESCTGGLLGAMLTSVPGSSDHFLASFVTYSDRAKVDTLGVHDRVLFDHGAVSAECAAEMASGARRAGRADIGLSITGIAGPGGGSATKPVGLTYIAVDDGMVSRVERHVFPGDRESVRKAAAERALEILLELMRPTS